MADSTRRGEAEFVVVKEEGTPGPPAALPVHDASVPAARAADPEPPAAPQLQASEALLILALFALVAWTCYTLYGPQIVGMLRMLAGPA